MANEMLVRENNIVFRVSAPERQAMERGAALAGQRLSQWARETLLREARRLERAGARAAARAPGSVAQRVIRQVLLSEEVA